MDNFSNLAKKEDYNAPIETNADELDYDKEKGRITASGHVVITYGTDELRADRVLINTETGDAYALGNVVIKRKGMADLKSAKVQYNFRTRRSTMDDPEIHIEPFHVAAKKITRAGQNEYVLHNAKVTTCSHPDPHTHYHFSAKRVTVVPGEYLKTKGAVLSVGRIPVFYVPYWRRNLNTESGFRFLPGYRSRFGGYLYSSYYHPIGESVKAEHHIDYRSERGFALGEDLDWHTGTSIGRLRLYYLNDDEPMTDHDIASGMDIDNQRYRIKFEHNQTFDERTLLQLKANYLSDSKVIEDFFDREYRRERQPENYASLSHRGNLYSITALANTRLNDFYSNVNRLPELALNFTRTQIGNSSFYYESYTSGSELEKVWQDGSDESDYSSLRFDTRHMVYQPRRYLGWLNFVPRAGYRGTYYSDTAIHTTTEDIVTTSFTNSATSVVSTQTSTNMLDQIANGPGKMRNIFELGAELSFKAFRTFSDGSKRHIVEPYLNYTFSMDPSVEASELYQFDNIDTLGEINQTRIGIRNKIQNKINGRPNDLADINIYTTLKFNTEDDEDVFDILHLDSDFYPTRWLYLNLYGSYSVAESVLETFNTRFYLKRIGMWQARLEHRYRDNDSNLLSGVITLHANSRWAFNTFGRYEFEESRAEEVGGYIEHKLDCIGMRLGGSVLPGYTRTDGTEEDDEYRVMVTVWLTAFPEFGISSKM